MNRRSFLRSIAVSVGLIAAGKSIAAPAPVVKYPLHEETPVSRLHYFWRETQPKYSVLNDGSVRKEINGGIGVSKGTSKKQADKWVRCQLPAVERGYKRVSMSITSVLYSNEYLFQTIDIQV